MEEIIYRELAKKYGLPASFILKDYYLMRLLQYVSLYGNNRFVLTGGTAINKVYLKDMARFSEDADFELSKRSEMKATIKLIDRIKFLAKDFVKTDRLLLKVYCQVDFSYLSLNNFSDNVRLDVALNEVADKSSYKIVDEIISPFSQERAYKLAVYTLEELLARKLYAVYRRTEGKDLYDIFYSLNLTDKKKFYSAGKRFFNKKRLDLSRTILKIIDKLRNLDDKYIAAKTNMYIPLALRPSNWKIVANSIADYLLEIIA